MGDGRGVTDEESPASARATPSARSSQFLRGVIVGALVAGVVGGGVGAVVAYRLHDDDADGTAPSATTTVTSRQTPGRGNVLAAVRAKDVPAVVKIGTGSGFVVRADGLIVTNDHVVAALPTIEVTLADGRKLPGTIENRQPSADLALVKVEATGLPVIELANSNRLVVGDPVAVVGNALVLEGPVTVTLGIVSGLDRSIASTTGSTAGTRLEHMIQTDAPINPGNSGGPVVDLDGRAVGIVALVAQPGEGQDTGFAIAVSKASLLQDALHKP
jgi:S1-C subfamily serine protease